MNKNPNLLLKDILEDSELKTKLLSKKEGQKLVMEFINALNGKIMNAPGGKVFCGLCEWIESFSANFIPYLAVILAINSTTSSKNAIETPIC